MKQENWLYFRNVADEDIDDGDFGSVFGSPTSLCIPASAIKQITPQGDTSVRISLDSLILFDESTAGMKTRFNGRDFLLLNVNQGKTQEVMQALAEVISGNNQFTVIADDMTTNAANATVAARYFHPDVTSCGVLHVFRTQQGFGMHEYYEQVVPGAVDDNDVAASLRISLPAQSIVLEAAMVCTSVATNDVGSVALEIHSAAIADDAPSHTDGVEILGADTVNLSIQGVTNAAGTKDVDNTSVPDADLDISSNATANSTVHSGVMDPIDRGTAATHFQVTAKEDMKSTAITGSPKVSVYIKWWGGPAVPLNA